MSVTTLKNRIKNTWKLDFISNEFANYSTKYLQSVAFDIFNHDFTRHVLTDIANKYSGAHYGHRGQIGHPLEATPFFILINSSTLSKTIYSS